MQSTTAQRQVNTPQNPSETCLLALGGCVTFRRKSKLAVDQSSLFDNSINMEISKAVQALTSLAHPSRLEVFRLLVRSERLCAGDLAEIMAVPKPTLSFHLKELSRAGLILSLIHI